MHPCHSGLISSNAKLTRNSGAGVCVTQCERSEHHTNDSAWIVECSFLLGAFRAHRLSYSYALSLCILALQTPTERTLYTQRLHDGRWAAFHEMVIFRTETANFMNILNTWFSESCSSLRWLNDISYWFFVMFQYYRKPKPWLFRILCVTWTLNDTCQWPIWQECEFK